MKSLNTKVNDIIQRTTIQFPCENYSIRVIGNKVESFAYKIYQVAIKYDPNCNFHNFQIQESSKGKYLSVRFSMKAESLDYLKKLNQDLRKLDFVQTVI